MEYEELEDFLSELDRIISDFSFYILDEANTIYDNPFQGEEKVISGMETFHGMLNKKIGMKIASFRVDLIKRKESLNYEN